MNNNKSAVEAEIKSMDWSPKFPRFYRNCPEMEIVVLFTSMTEGMVISHPTLPFGHIEDAWIPCTNTDDWEPCEVGFEVILRQKY